MGGVAGDQDYWCFRTGSDVPESRVVDDSPVGRQAVRSVMRMLDAQQQTVATAPGARYAKIAHSALSPNRLYQFSTLQTPVAIRIKTFHQ
jgi:hypothetical protein